MSRNELTWWDFLLLSCCTSGPSVYSGIKTEWLEFLHELQSLCVQRRGH